MYNMRKCLCESVYVDLSQSVNLSVTLKFKDSIKNLNCPCPSSQVTDLSVALPACH